MVVTGAVVLGRPPGVGADTGSDAMAAHVVNLADRAAARSALNWPKFEWKFNGEAVSSGRLTALLDNAHPSCAEESAAAKVDPSVCRHPEHRKVYVKAVPLADMPPFMGLSFAVPVRRSGLA